MFSGFITHQKLSEAPRELEALYDAWLIAGRLVEAGAVVPQIYRPMDDIFAVRWIPAVMDDEVKAVTEAVGAAFSHVGPEFLAFRRRLLRCIRCFLAKSCSNSSSRATSSPHGAPMSTKRVTPFPSITRSSGANPSTVTVIPP